MTIKKPTIISKALGLSLQNYELKIIENNSHVEKHMLTIRELDSNR